jgi:hypothetical protein
VPFIPPYPVPPARKPGLLGRFVLGWGSWVHTLFAGAYTMKLGHTRLPRLSVFMVNELSLVRRVLGGGDFPKHDLLADMLGPLVGSSVFSANGAQWRRQRAMVNPAFVHANLARAFPMMLAAADDMVVRLKAAARKGPVCIDPLMTHVTADIIFRTLFSVPLDEAGRAPSMPLSSGISAMPSVARFWGSIACRVWGSGGVRKGRRAIFAACSSLWCGGGWPGGAQGRYSRRADRCA